MRQQEKKERNGDQKNLKTLFFSINDGIENS